MSELTKVERALEKAWQEEGGFQPIPWTFASGWVARGQYDALLLEVERTDHEAAKERLRLAAQRISELEHRLNEMRESMEYIDVVISTHSTLELDDHWYDAVSRTLSDALEERSS